MKKIKDYPQIIFDLSPIFEKWGEENVVGALWHHRRSKGKLAQLKVEKERIDKELKKYENLSR